MRALCEILRYPAGWVGYLFGRTTPFPPSPELRHAPCSSHPHPSILSSDPFIIQTPHRFSILPFRLIQTTQLTKSSDDNEEVVQQYFDTWTVGYCNCSHHKKIKGADFNEMSIGWEGICCSGNSFKRFAKMQGTTCERKNWSVDCVVIFTCNCSR